MPEWTESHYGGAPYSGGRQPDQALLTRYKDLERKLERLELVAAAMWELLKEKTGVTGQDLDAKMREIDLRDGVADTRITAVPVRCPSCQRVSTSRSDKCLYCGLEFAVDHFS